MSNTPCESETLDQLVEPWAAKITKSSGITVEAIVTNAENVRAALQELAPHGRKARQLLALRSGLSRPMMSKLETIGRHAQLLRHRAGTLPPSMSSLYTLARKPWPEFKRAVMMDLRGKSRAEIKALFVQPSPPKLTRKLMTILVPPDLSAATRRVLMADIGAALARIAEDRRIDLDVASPASGPEIAHMREDRQASITWEEAPHLLGQRQDEQPAEEPSGGDVELLPCKERPAHDSAGMRRTRNPSDIHLLDSSFLQVKNPPEPRQTAMQKLQAGCPQEMSLAKVGYRRQSAVSIRLPEARQGLGLDTMDHPVLNAIRRESFTPLGWFSPNADDRTPPGTQFVILIGNAGPQMFRRFARERNPSRDLMDDWCRHVIDRLARDLDAGAAYPFDKPPLPFLTWARRAKAGHVSPLGMNIHSTYGLWHAFRAALLFPVAFDLPAPSQGPHPCETCAGKPCLSACPVGAFSGTSYDVPRCIDHIASPQGSECMTGGCLARRACPVGTAFLYGREQMQFHMRAFLKAHRPDGLHS